MKKAIEKIASMIEHINNGWLHKMYFTLQRNRDMHTQDSTREIIENHPNPLNRFGRKCFSQTDEDGITIEILRRMDALENGCFAEFGVGDGLENNSLLLISLGWKGFWVGGQDLAFKAPENSQFINYNVWIVIENITKYLHAGMAHLHTKKLDVISLDLDGNDIYFIEKILSSGIEKSKLFIVEYNAKFIPPIEFQIQYDATHPSGINPKDYYGASLMSFVKLFAKFGYKLVCCNSHTGANAFFVDDQYSHLFSDIPEEINDIFMEPRYFIYHYYCSGRSPKTVEKKFRDNEDSSR